MELSDALEVVLSSTVMGLWLNCRVCETSERVSLGGPVDLPSLVAMGEQHMMRYSQSHEVVTRSDNG